MGVLGFLSDLFDRWGVSGGVDAGAGRSMEPDPGVNPATGLPMLDGGIDVMGNPLGIDLHRHDHHHHHDGFDDRWGGSFSSSWHDTSRSWPDHSSSSYDPSRGW